MSPTLQEQALIIGVQIFGQCGRLYFEEIQKVPEAEAVKDSSSLLIADADAFVLMPLELK